jgi:hypothetical protein
MNAELKLSALNSLEGDIRTMVRGNRLPGAIGLCDDILAAAATSIADIDKLIEELQIARDYLKAEGDRVHRLTSRYAHLTQTASASVKVIADSLGKWRVQDSSYKIHATSSEALSPDMVPDAEVCPEVNQG